MKDAKVIKVKITFLSFIFLYIGHFNYAGNEREHFSNLVLRQDKFVEEFCQNGGECDAQEVDRELKNFVSQIMFLLKG